MSKTRTCTKCGETKPVDDFHRISDKPCGRRSQCKVCVRKVSRKRKVERTEKHGYVSPGTIRTCKRCGEKFNQKKGGTPQIYCCKACQFPGNRLAKTDCRYCGKVFLRQQGKVEWYCSDECRKAGSQVKCMGCGALFIPDNRERYCITCHELGVHKNRWQSKSEWVPLINKYGEAWCITVREMKQKSKREKKLTPWDQCFKYMMVSIATRNRDASLTEGGEKRLNSHSSKTWDDVFFKYELYSNMVNRREWGGWFRRFDNMRRNWNRRSGCTK